MTSQRPEKKLPLIELFGPTIQGEGSMCGKHTFFLRLGVCDYKCTMCDSKHAVDPEQIQKWATYLTATEIAEQLRVMNEAYQTPYVTITGGNPCVHNLSHLVDQIHANGMKIAIETQGTFCPDWLMKCDLVTISPKGPGMGETFNEALYDVFLDKLIIPSLDKNKPDNFPETCIKVVIFDEADMDFAKMIWAYTPEAPMYLSLGNSWLPEDHIGHTEHVKALLNRYEALAEKMYKDPILNKAIFLPQLHALVWSNDKGR